LVGKIFLRCLPKKSSSSGNGTNLMAAPKYEDYSSTGRMIFARAMDDGLTPRKLKNKLFGRRAAQARLTEFLKREHTIPKLMEIAEILECLPSELLPRWFWDRPVGPGRSSEG